MTVKKLIEALNKLPENLEVKQIDDTDYGTLGDIETARVAYVARVDGRYDWYEVNETKAGKLKTGKKIVIVEC